MPSNPLVTAFFGPGSVQDAEKLFILKADLQAPVGLPSPYEFTPLVDNTAEALFLAIFLRAQRNQDFSRDSQMVISPFERELVTRYGNPEIRYFCTFEVFVRDTLSKTPSPNLI
jgi:hypothetical protein